ncbi:hypothetical protein [Amycolatopsis rubida]|uniref:Mce-associated membrane protein n=1 Tax=Amycolatopsis rubida TaxID=112413 RepID=A0A1I5MIA4_9PSEU|nr:hypothetical protein [Amycolatopsis rubida]SFP09249.1 Mce-associated membrane protein [Amycolatopsis rubida]
MKFTQRWSKSRTEPLDSVLSDAPAAAGLSEVSASAKRTTTTEAAQPATTTAQPADPSPLGSSTQQITTTSDSQPAQPTISTSEDTGPATANSGSDPEPAQPTVSTSKDARPATANSGSDSQPAQPTVSTSKDARPATANSGSDPEPAQPIVSTSEDTRPATADPAGTAQTPILSTSRLPALLFALTILLTAAGVWCTIEARSTSASAAASNHALTDQPATAEVTSAISLTLNKIFSYTYDKTDVTENAAATLLRGHARDSYEKLFAQVRTMAPSQRLTLTSRVSATSVQQLTNDHAQLLVFLDQSAARGNSTTPETAAAQLAVTADRIDGNWFITDLAPR